MAENVNTAYEVLAKEIYQTLLQEEGFENIDVKHNVKILGKSGCEHQIDVYWEFRLGGENHRVAIECKNYNDTVSIAKVRDFYGVIDDIGNIKGILLSKVGFQYGTIKFAEQYGISLKLLRFPTDEDWEGRLKTIHIDFNMYVKEIRNRTFDFDIEWILENTTHKKGDQLTIGYCLTNEILIVDAKGKEITNLYKLENELPTEFKEEYGLQKQYSFKNAFLTSPNNEPFKIKSITYDYDVLCIQENSIIDGEKSAKAILKDIRSGEIKFFDNKGNVK